MMKKALILTIAVMVVLLAGCGGLPAVEKESAKDSQTVSFTAGNETESRQEPTKTAKDTATPVQKGTGKKGKVSSGRLPSGKR